MSITFNRQPGQRLLELGGGSNPTVIPACMGGQDVHVDARMCNNAQGQRCVDFTADFNQPLPIGSDEFDACIAIFVLEHLSYLSIPSFLKEIFRVLKPGAKLVMTTPNTEAQLRWILDHPEGWDGKNLFLAASEKLFGDQAHSQREGGENIPIDSHKAYLNPTIITQLLQEAGFQGTLISPYGERATDMAIQAQKPPDAPKSSQEPSREAQGTSTLPGASESTGSSPGVSEGNIAGQGGNVKDDSSEKSEVPPAQRFNRAYFDGIGYKPFYWDFPYHHVTTRHVLARTPRSVISLGCGRMYVEKRLEDRGIKVIGLDVSKHCELTRVSSDFILHDLCEIPWPVVNSGDMVFSMAFWEHIPEKHIPAMVAEMERVGERGLHGITFIDTPGAEEDPQRTTLRSREWWRERLPKSHEIFSREELESGPLPPDVIQGDGKLKVNFGSYMTQFHHGWENSDIYDQLMGWSAQNGYKYRKIDVRGGTPYNTGTVDLIYHAHMIEHLEYREGLAFLRECRRIIKPDTGAMRIICPDAQKLTEMYLNYPKGLEELGEMNGGCAAAPTSLGKLHAILYENHKALYDQETLCSILDESGWIPLPTEFRLAGIVPYEGSREGNLQILKETLDVLWSISLVVDAIPKVG